MRARMAALAMLVLAAACAVDEPRDGRRAQVLGPGPSSPSATGPVGTGSQPGLTAPGASGVDPAGVAPGSSTGAGGTYGPGSSSTGTGGTTGSGGRSSTTTGGGGSTVGVTSKQVTFSVSGNFSGAAGQVASQAYESGIGTWVHDVNSRGGVLGRQVRVLKLNDEDNSTGGREVCKQVQSNGSLFVLVMQSNTAAVDCVSRAGIPAYASAVPKDVRRPHVFSSFLDPDRGRLVAKFAKESLGGGTKKVGIIHLNNPQYKSVSDAFVTHARSLGMSVAPPEAVAPNQASFTSELLRLQRAGAQIVAIAAIVESIGIIRDANAINYRPAWTGVVYCVDEFSAAAVDVFRGVKCLRQYQGAEKPSYQQFRQKARAAGHAAYATTSAMAIYGMATILERAMTLAGPELTRERMEAAFRRMRYDNGIQPQVDWRTGRVYGAQALYAVECCSDDRTWRTLGLIRL